MGEQVQQPPDAAPSGLSVTGWNKHQCRLVLQFPELAKSGGQVAGVLYKPGRAPAALLPTGCHLKACLGPRAWLMAVSKPPGSSHGTKPDPSPSQNGSLAREGLHALKNTCRSNVRAGFGLAQGPSMDPWGHSTAYAQGPGRCTRAISWLLGGPGASPFSPSFPSPAFVFV